MGRLGSPLVGARGQGSSEPLLSRAAGSGGVAGRVKESTRDGGLEDAIRSFSGCGHLHTHLPHRPWLNKLLQVIGRTPLGREKGDRKDRRKHTGKGRPSLCAPGPGWQKGAGRSRLGSGNVPPPDRKLSSASFPGPSAPSSAPRRRGWLGAVAERGLGSLWQLLHPGSHSGPGVLKLEPGV